ncbi:hypothetical protein BSPWISOXPB_8023 [uncultured Gammaproteobacteria bacterium]|nr:hypothetical protein BSPWISOXPB_8023 [uncultured Gammaproteobacteria bacterium]
MVFLAFNLEQEESGIEKVNANSSLSLSLFVNKDADIFVCAFISLLEIILKVLL